MAKKITLTGLLMAFLLIAGSWLRLYRLDETLMFQGDQGRDALIVARMWQEFDPAFIGPVTSVGNMYLGPFYYYFMLPWLFLTYPSPIGPAIGVALVSVATIFLLYYWGEKMVGKTASLWASGFFAFSLMAIEYARFSWNPNLSPFFALLTLFLTHQAMTKPKNWLWVALSAGLLAQLHYVNLIIVAVAGIFWLKQIITNWQNKTWLQKNKFWLYSLSALMIFSLTHVPLILFDWKHEWLNLQAAAGIFSQESSFTAESGDNSFLMGMVASVQEVPGRLGHLFSTLALPQVDVYYLRVGLGVISLALFLLLAWTKRRSKQAIAYQILAVTAIISVIALAFYRHSVFDHYVLFFLPVLFLIWGCLLAKLQQFKIAYLITGLLMVGIFAYGNYQPGFFQDANPNPAKLSLTAQTIINHVPTEETYTLVLIGASKDYYGSNYRYFVKAQRPKLLPPEQNSQAQHLFIIDELGNSDIFNLNIYEIDTYPGQKVTEAFLVPETNVKIYHLESNTDE